MNLYADRNGTSIYVKENDELQIGDAKLEHIFYVFWNNKFAGATIEING